MFKSNAGCGPMKAKNIFTISMNGFECAWNKSTGMMPPLYLHRNGTISPQLSVKVHTVLLYDCMPSKIIQC